MRWQQDTDNVTTYRVTVKEEQQVHEIKGICKNLTMLKEIKKKKNIKMDPTQAIFE